MKNQIGNIIGILSITFMIALGGVVIYMTNLHKKSSGEEY